MKLALNLPVREFCRLAKSNQLFVDLERAFLLATGRNVGPSERASWAGSLPRISGILELVDLDSSVHIGLEVQIPYYSERIDVAVYGYGTSGHPCVVLIELKQWSDVEESGDRLYVRMRTGLVPVIHPSAQVDAYRRHISNFVRAFHNPPAVELFCCAYLHNYRGHKGPLFQDAHHDAISLAPLFCSEDAIALANFIASRVGRGQGLEIIDRISREGLAPSRSLVDQAAAQIRLQDVFTMLDEQIPAQESLRRALSRSIRSKSKTVILVEGGPGTGKSVIALDSLGHALKDGRGVFLVSGSAAFTHGMRRLLGPELSSLVKFTDYFWQHSKDSVDVLIVDEAHRMRAKSVPRVTTDRRPTISQLEELVRAAKVSLLFMDTNQIIEPDERGSPAEVEALARRLNAKFERHSLKAQFRCNGSDNYLAWVDAVFGLNAAPCSLLQSPDMMDLRICESPGQVLDWVRSKNAAFPNSARLTSGWCWPWSDPKSDGELVQDIVIEDFMMPWELKNGKKAAGKIPEAKYWAVDGAGAEQAGTVYSVQGFEFRYVGILMGPDLTIRNGKWAANPRANFRNSIRAKSPAVAEIYIRRIYRALFTRPLRGVRVYSVDRETREFLKSKIITKAESL